MRLKTDRGAGRWRQGPKRANMSLISFKHHQRNPQVTAAPQKTKSRDKGKTIGNKLQRIIS